MEEQIFKQLATKADLEELVTKEEFDGFKNENFSRLDEIMVVLRRVDQERVFTFEHIKRLESDIDKNRHEIDRIKAVLKIC